MTDFFTNIEPSQSNILDIEISSLATTLSNISYASIDTTFNNNCIIELETTFLNDVNNIFIERSSDYNLTLTNTVYANLPDEIPMSIIVGNLDVSRIDNLDVYLSTIPIDGGSP